MNTPSMAVLVIMDGLALNPSTRGNAVAAAKTPVLDHLMATYPMCRLAASGRDVGLMDGQMGDSNVGHLNIGAGRIVKQYVLRILDAIDDGEFFQNPVLVRAVQGVKERGTALHILGIVSPGGVHGHTRIVQALASMAKTHGVERVYVHAFTDGRDVPPTSGYEYIKELEAALKERGEGVIASVSGRYFAMDRDRRWERTKKAYDAVVLGDGLRAASAAEAVQAAYDRGETDEFVTPTVIVDASGAPLANFQPGDGVIFANFRADRARQLTRSLIEPDFSDFERARGHIPVEMTTMTRYDATYDVPFAFHPQNMANILGEIVAQRGWKQLRIAETEKYAHVTYFFNGGREEPFPGEVQRLIPSPKVATYDLKPEMSAYEVTEEAVKGIKSGEYRLVVINFANCDMVGHTGVFEAAVKAVETVDTCVGRVVEAVQAMGGAALVTADHGNADQMIEYETGGPHTFHTLYPVPCILVSEMQGIRLRDGRLADIAPTLLELLGAAKPEEMDGETLIVRP